MTIPDFVQEYLDENPDAVLDARLMTGLNTMATNLVERTFDEKNISPIRQPTVGHFWTCDYFMFFLFFFTNLQCLWSSKLRYLGLLSMTIFR